MKKFQTEKDKNLALKVQLHFPQKVLGVRCVFVSPVLLEKENSISKERASKAALKEAQKYKLGDNTTLTQSRKRGRKNDNIQQKTKTIRVCEVATVLSSIDE